MVRKQEAACRADRPLLPHAARDKAEV